MPKPALGAWLFIAMLLTLAGSASAFEARESALIGGPGGTNNADQCTPPYDFLTGIRYSAGKDLNEVRGICLPYVGNEKMGAPYDLKFTWGHPPAKGSSPPGIADAIVCPTGQIVFGIEVLNSHAPLVHGFRLTCKPAFGGGGASVTRWSRTGGGAGTTSQFVDCGGSPAIGIAVRHGGNIDALGLLCGVNPPTPPAPKPAPTPAPPVPKPSAPVKPPIKVDNSSGANGGGFAQKRASGGSSGSAATATTIYAAPGGGEIAYLQVGDPVTIVSCNDNNWCQISRPVGGWVWGDDLNH